MSLSKSGSKSSALNSLDQPQTDHQLPQTNYLPPQTKHRLTQTSQPFKAQTDCLARETDCRAPQTDHRPPQTDHRPPQTDRGHKGRGNEDRGHEETGGDKPLRKQARDTAARRELRTVLRKRENLSSDSKHQFLSMERQKAVLELSVLAHRTEIRDMDKVIAKEEKVLDRMEAEIKNQNRLFEERLKEHEKTSVEARAFFEREAQSKQQKMTEIKKLMSEISITENDLEKIEETLLNYKSYRDLLFRLSPPDWQEEHHNKEDLRGWTQKKSGNKSETEETSDQNDPELEDSRFHCDPSQFEENPELFFTDPQQLLDILTELTEKNLSLIQNSSRLEETLEELEMSICSTKTCNEKEESVLSLQINDTKQKIEAEKFRGNKLKQKVQLHLSLHSQDQEALLDALGQKVSQVHQRCVDHHVSTFSTLEKLTLIESSLSNLLQNLDQIPEDKLQLMRRIKESEKRARQREEKLKEQQEKQKERIRRYLERSMSETKIMKKKKSVLRTVPLVQKEPVSKVDELSVEDDIQKYLFPSDESD